MILAGWLTGEERERIDRSLENVAILPRARLKAELETIRGNVDELRRTLGAKSSAEDYERLLAEATQEDRILFVPKWLIEQVFFSRYEQAFPDFRQLPAHARIAVDVHGILRPRIAEASWRLLEATLFEDMALLWNHAVAAAESKRRENTKESTKWLDSLLRATTRGTFHLLEGYLNGIAVDILVAERHLSESDEATLLEWDNKHSRSRPRSLRDKLLQYPRIAVHAEHPPLSESNCPELRLIVEREAIVRHALVHPTPRDEGRRGDRHPARRLEPRDAARTEEARESDLREAVFFTLTLENVTEIVDGVIRLIQRLSATVGEAFGNVELWLFQRDEAGRFPARSFS